MSRRQKKPVSFIYLDEIDVLQMAFATLEMSISGPVLEAFGLFFGEVEHRRGRVNFRLHFIHTIQRATRMANPAAIFLNEKRLKRLAKRYNFRAIGDFHSHPADTSRYPSHIDLDDLVRSESPARGGVFAIILAERVSGAVPENGTNVVVRHKTKITCHLADFVISLYFYRLKDGVESIPRNVAAQKLVERVYPRCIARKKLYKDKPRKQLKVV